MDYIWNIAILATAFWLGWKIRTAVIMYHLSENPDRMIGILNKIKEINEHKETPEKVAKGDVKIEHHNGQVYLFETETDRFLAQGETISDAIAVMDKRFPGRFSLKVVIPDSHSA